MVMTVRGLRIRLGWSLSDLADRAGISPKTVKNIERGKPVYDYTLSRVARAFSEALGREVSPEEFDEWKNVIES
jgi:transcriptional regulator with XRE-family HTH domain